jgi:uncharacterized protein YndB with AHSA1/START domain
MSADLRQLEFKVRIKSSVNEVYRALIHPTALCDWFCRAAQVDPRPGGRMYCYWEGGYYVNAEFTTLGPGKAIHFTWQGKGESLATHVQVNLTPENGQTSLVLTHSGIPSDPAWDTNIVEFKKGWEAGLENLQSVLETGIDLREARRPMLGIFIGDFSPEIAKKLGTPAESGVRLTGVMDGLGAQASGLQADDVVVGMAGEAIKDIASFDPIKQRFHAGDEVEVVFYRGAELKKVAMKLGTRQSPKLAKNAPALAKAVAKDFRQLNKALNQRLAACPEPLAERRPAQDTWSIKETLAHLIQCERDQQTWVADMLNDQDIPDSLEYSPNVLLRLQALVQVYPTVTRLLAEFKRSQKETIILLMSLPESFVARKHLFNRLAMWYLFSPEHHRDHLAQIDALLVD